MTMASAMDASSGIASSVRMKAIILSISDFTSRFHVEMGRFAMIDIGRPPNSRTAGDSWEPQPGSGQATICTGMTFSASTTSSRRRMMIRAECHDDRIDRTFPAERQNSPAGNRSARPCLLTLAIVQTLDFRRIARIDRHDHIGFEGKPAGELPRCA